MSSIWRPEQYDKFKALRSKPFYDLATMLDSTAKVNSAIDLGCGTGELTAWLHKEKGFIQTLGIDNSDTMLDKAPKVDGLEFELKGIQEYLDEATEKGLTYDLVFTNAALQWLPDHDKLWSDISKLVKDGGQLAIQIPSNHDHPSHTLAAELALEEPFVSHLGGWYRKSPVESVEFYAQQLFKAGFKEQDVRLQVYGHVLDDSAQVVEWVKGTNLTDYQKRMPAKMYEEFLEKYKKRLLPVLGDAKPHFYPFKRILMWARK